MKFWTAALLNRFILYSVACFLAFLFGRHTAKFNTVKQEVKEVVTYRTIIKTKKPGGETRTVVTEEINSRTKTVTKPGPKVNVSALAGVDTTSSILKPVYGISVSKEFIGPITVGAYGLTNGTVGLSLGVNF